MVLREKDQTDQCGARVEQREREGEGRRFSSGPGILSALLSRRAEEEARENPSRAGKSPVGLLTGRPCRVLCHALPCPWHGALGRSAALALRHSVLNIPGPSGAAPPSPARENTPESGET